MASGWDRPQFGGRSIIELAETFATNTGLFAVAS